MRVFWGLVLVLLLTAGVMILMRAAPRPGADVRESSMQERGGALPESPQPQIRPDPAPTEPVALPSAPGTDAAPAAPDSPAGALTPNEPAEPMTTSDATPAPDPTPETTPEPSPEAAPEPAELAPEPGTIMLNGRYRIPGEGTESKPYILSWDTLTALESEYNPKKEGMKEIPEWIRVLDGKHVSITGFIAFAFIAPTADECMVMLNQWDGCCIGVPPTPYDAVEVKLATTLDLQQGIINYGTITGVFRTDPYLVNGWLIGLYVMDHAAVTKAGAKNQAGF